MKHNFRSELMIYAGWFLWSLPATNWLLLSYGHEQDIKIWFMIILPINCDIFKYQPIKSLLTPIFGKAILFTHFTFVDISALIHSGHGHRIDLDARPYLIPPVLYKWIDKRIVMNKTLNEFYISCILKNNQIKGDILKRSDFHITFDMFFMKYLW